MGGVRRWAESGGRQGRQTRPEGPIAPTLECGKHAMVSGGPGRSLQGVCVTSVLERAADYAIRGLLGV